MGLFLGFYSTDSSLYSDSVSIGSLFLDLLYLCFDFWAVLVGVLGVERAFLWRLGGEGSGDTDLSSSSSFLKSLGWNMIGFDIY